MTPADGRVASLADRDRSAASGLLEVLDLACGVLSGENVDVVLKRVLEAARRLTGARYAALGVLDRSQHELERFTTAGLDDSTRQQIGALPRGRGVLGELIIDPRPLRLADVGAHPHSYGFPSGHPEMKTFLGVPLLVAGKPFGNLYLTDKRRGEQFTTADEQVAMRLAELAGMAIDHARRHGGVENQPSQLTRTVDALDANAIATARSVELVSQRIAAAEQERARWARQLHDETLQTLAALRIGLATQLGQEAPRTLTEVVHDAVAELESEVSNLRSLITELRPTTLDDYGVEAAIEVLAERARRDGLDVELRVDLNGGERVRHNTELETTIYRITQEALVNARRHSGARRALIELRTYDDCIQVIVCDDGHGFDPRGKTTGFGLHSMRERAELLRGVLIIKSAPGQGTHITANLPTRQARSQRPSLGDPDPPVSHAELCTNRGPDQVRIEPSKQALWSPKEA
jgi:signal transduction histidine kinase